MTKASSLRVIVADDDASVRQRVRQALNATSDLDLIAMVRDGGEAWRAALEMMPDVLVLDDAMPIAGGLDVLTRLRTEAPQIRIVLHVDDPANCIDAAQLGAAGCAGKGMPLDALLSAIRASVVARSSRKCR